MLFKKKTKKLIPVICAFLIMCCTLEAENQTYKVLIKAHSSIALAFHVYQTSLYLFFKSKQFHFLS